MEKYAEKIRGLRELAGKSDTEMAEMLEMSIEAYGDLETHDDELTTVPSVRQVKTLAKILSISIVQLLAKEDFSHSSINHINYENLVKMTKDYIRSNSSNQKEFEDRVGWALADFFAGQDSAWDNYPIEFLQDLCRELGVNWLETLPN